MLRTDHCILCDHRKVDFMTGSLCGLTEKKPDFSQKCNVIKLDEAFKDQIVDVNIDYEAVQKTRVDVFGHCIFYVLIALGFFIAGFLIGKYALDSGVISTVPLIIMGIGIVPLGMAVGPVNYYLTSLKIAKNKKRTLDTLAKMYGYSYTIDIEHLKDSLGNLSYNIKAFNLHRTSNTRA